MLSVPPLQPAVEAIANFYGLRGRTPIGTLSGLYSLHPTCDLPVPMRWPAQYPNCDATGLYLVYNELAQLLYVGKANRIGHRLGNYFGEDQDPTVCVILSSEWSSRPGYVATIVTADETEALELERHLIRELDPPDNKQHRRLCRE